LGERTGVLVADQPTLETILGHLEPALAAVDALARLVADNPGVDLFEVSGGDDE